MPKFSVIRDNKVINLIIADSKEDAELLTKTECIEFNDDFLFGPGSEYNGSEWILPPKNTGE